MSPTSETAHGGRRLVIVESPAKAKTIKGYLGPGYIVEASVGHIRDLPNGAAEVPEKYTGEVRRLGVDVDHDFQPIYVVNADKKAQVRKLKDLLKESDELFLATDEDREGEAIAWHLQEVLKPKVPVHRMVFHEITKDAIRAAVANPRELNQQLVDAQETRRILDRLYGYEVSPVLWKKVMPRPVGRPCPVRGHPARRRAGARAHRVPFRRVLGPDRHLRHRPRGRRVRPVARWSPGSAGRRQARRAGPRLRLRRRSSSSATRSLHLDETNARALAAALEDTPFAVRVRRVQAVPPLAVRAVPYDDAAAGGQPQARLRREGAPCRSRRSCTRTASSPTCVRTPPRCPRRRSPPPAPRSRSCTAPTTCRTQPRTYAGEGQERAGGARGDPPLG